MISFYLRNTASGLWKVMTRRFTLICHYFFKHFDIKALRLGPEPLPFGAFLAHTLNLETCLLAMLLFIFLL